MHITPRVTGMLMGAFVGDALGAPHEFRSSKAVYTGTMEHKAVITSRWQKQKIMTVGQLTDDSEMMITLMRSLIACKGYNRDHVCEMYMKWANSHPAGMGHNTRRLFCGITTKNGFDTRWQKICIDNNCQSNGALMRSAPLAVLSNFKDAVLQDSMLSNPNKLTCFTTVLYVEAVRMALQGTKREAIITYIHHLITGCPYDDIKTALQQAIKGEKRDVTVNKGWCLHAFYCAFYSLAHHDNITTAYNWIISLKGDTDTNACIAGALLGACLDINHMVNDTTFLHNVNIMLSCDTNTGDAPRPPQYTTHDINTVITSLVSLYT